MNLESPNTCILLAPLSKVSLNNKKNAYNSIIVLVPGQHIDLNVIMVSFQIKDTSYKLLENLDLLHESNPMP